MVERDHGVEGRPWVGAGGGAPRTQRGPGGHVPAPQGSSHVGSALIRSSAAGGREGAGGASDAQSYVISPGAGPSAQGLSPSTPTLCRGLSPVTALPALRFKLLSEGAYKSQGMNSPVTQIQNNAIHKVSMGWISVRRLKSAGAHLTLAPVRGHVTFAITGGVVTS